MKKLSEWLAVTAPLKSVEACSICSKIPASCMRFEKGGKLESDDIPEDVKRLEKFLGENTGWRGEVKRCPECHRPYWYEEEYEFLIPGSEDTWLYRRVDPEAQFRDDWFIRYRIGATIRTPYSQGVFRHHSIATLRDGSWIALHDEGEVTPLASSADLRRLGPTGLNDEKLARQYLYIVDAIDNVPPLQRLERWNYISWKWTLTDDEKHQIEDLRGASRVEPERVERLADRVLVKQWLLDRENRRLIYRIISIFPDGTIRREDAVIGEDLPLLV